MESSEATIKIPCPICSKFLELEFGIEMIICSGCNKVFKVKLDIILEEIKCENLK